LDEFYEWAIFFLELFDVLGFVVDRVSFSESEHNADPFEGEYSDGGLVFAAGLSFLTIESGRPGTPLAGMVGELVKCLLQEFGAGVAA
jgi:hypothetical protein